MLSGLGWQVLLFFAGLVGLYFGARGFVLGSSRMAEGMGVSRLTIGFTLVAFGTSLPEFANGITSALKGRDLLAVGNMLGSNIANVGLILALAVLIHPIKVKAAEVRWEVIFLVSVSALFYLLVLNRELGRLDGLLLLIAFGIYLWRRYTHRREIKLDKELVPPVARRYRLAKAIERDSLLALGGLVMLFGSAQLVVNAAVAMAQAFGVSSGVIGLSLVAMGTTLPELTTALVAARHREYDILIGNVVGSNVFNLLWILGFVSVIHPLRVDARWLTLQVPAMLLFSLALLPVLRKRGVIPRWEGALLLAGYVAFIVLIYAL